MSDYKIFFSMEKDPFSSDISEKKLFLLPDYPGIKQRVDYIIDTGSVMIITGDVGSGKSTSLRWVLSSINIPDIFLVNITGTTGSLVDFYKQLCWELGIEIKGSGKPNFLKNIQAEIKALVMKKKKILIVIDEANLLKNELFMEIHLLSQFEYDSKNYIAMIFAGHASLIEKLRYNNVSSLASRVVIRVHFNGINLEKMEQYISHHMSIVGVRKSPFNDSALIAIQQGSRGLIVAAKEKSNIVSAEHIRIASTKLIIWKIYLIFKFGKAE